MSELFEKTYNYHRLCVRDVGKGYCNHWGTASRDDSLPNSTADTVAKWQAGSKNGRQRRRGKKMEGKGSGRETELLSLRHSTFCLGGGLDGWRHGGGIIRSRSQFTQTAEKQFEHVSDAEVERRPKGTPWQFYWLTGRGIDSLILSSHMK